MVLDIKVSIGIVGAIFKFLKQPFKAVWNGLWRPKIKIVFKNHVIVIKDSSEKESHQNYPCLLVSFSETVKLNAKDIKINNETLSCLFQSDKNFLNQKDGSQNRVEVLNCPIYKQFSEKWLDVLQGTVFIDVPNHEPLIIPLDFKKAKSHILFNPKKNPKLLCASKKLILTLNINGKDFEYGIPLDKVCKVVINHLAFQVN